MEAILLLFVLAVPLAARRWSRDSRPSLDREHPPGWGITLGLPRYR